MLIIIRMGRMRGYLEEKKGLCSWPGMFQCLFQCPNLHLLSVLQWEIQKNNGRFEVKITIWTIVSLAAGGLGKVEEGERRGEEEEINHLSHP